MHSRGFAPIEHQTARVLVLGTLPSQISLERQQYYARPGNAFWRIMGELFGAGLDLPYEARVRKLTDSGIAIWDVCQTAHRPGSLDSSIRHPKPNDFAAFLEGHARIKLICFNGAKAADLFDETRVSLDRTYPTMQYRTLPSTSPANARMSFSEKLACWSIMRDENL